jgi:hypothetical protein
MSNPYDVPASLIKLNYRKPSISHKDIAEALEIVDTLLKDFYAKPEYTPEERKIVWSLSMVGDLLKKNV